MSSMLFDLAIGKSVQTKKWTNKKYTWPQLVERLVQTTYTSETHAEYLKAPKDEQSIIKDVGGYVAGYLENGKRNIDSIKGRQILTLDIDFGTPDFWDTFTLLYGCAAALHGTHKHIAEKPRYRLIVPLARRVSPSQYEAISRKLAATLGMKLFDSTTFQPNRLMFWPSTPTDIQYYFEIQEGSFLNPDEILDQYTDWRDISLWPKNPEEKKARVTKVRQQQNPTEKTGTIGAFCKAYSISQAIETFLIDTYSGGPDRYTYAGGETFGGLVVYDDLFAYSHHQSDPCSGQTCNAFDLVRIHKFGSKGINKMMNFAAQDSQVKKQIFQTRNPDFDKLDWVEDLQVNPQGIYNPCTNNINLIFKNDPRIKGVFKRNDFDQRNYVFRSVPWRKAPVKTPEVIQEVDMAGIQDFFDTNYGIVSRKKIEDSLILELQKQAFHPVRDYLSALVWDNTERIDHLLVDYFGALDTVYTREAARKWLTAGVARIFRPGVKFDNVLTLQGEEGVGKSTFGAKLRGKWFSDSLHTVKGKEAFESISGAWIIEIPELAGFKRAEVEEIKHFLSKQEDSYRPAYGRVVQTHKRQCIFLGSTNDKDFLISTSGNRRFFPIQIDSAKATKSIFKLDRAEVNQIWAEAYQAFINNEKLYLSPEAEEIAKAEQLNHTQTDQRAGLIEQFLNKPLPDNWETLDLDSRKLFHSGGEFKGETKEREHVCVAEIWCECFEKPIADMAQYKTREINAIMRSLPDWQSDPRSTKRFKLYGTQKFFTKKVK